jgi:hypothetical protein
MAGARAAGTARGAQEWVRHEDAGDAWYVNSTTGELRWTLDDEGGGAGPDAGAGVGMVGAAGADARADWVVQTENGDTWYVNSTTGELRWTLDGV